MCLIIIINPVVYANACLDAISVWTFKIFPFLFPFFVLTKMIVNLSEFKPNFIDKLFNKLYHTPNGSFNIFFLSSLSGYPNGARLISDMYINRQINKGQASKMMSFCSVSGPMFMVGTVGIMMLNSFKVGLIILISNTLASLINGLIYKGKKEQSTKISYKANNSNTFSECVYNSLISILMVGAYIVLSFLLIEILNNLGTLNFLSLSICRVFNCVKYQDLVRSIISGLFEITNGISLLSAINLNLKIKAIVASSLIGFSGLSIILQSMGFTSKFNMPLKTILIQKTTQSLLCLLFSWLLCSIFI